jgi:hypothetical protein
MERIAVARKTCIDRIEGDGVDGEGDRSTRDRSDATSRVGGPTLGPFMTRAADLPRSRSRR